MNKIGNYDDVATRLTLELEALAVVLIVTDGKRGHGLSLVTRDPRINDHMPALLREAADNIERLAAQGKAPPARVLQVVTKAPKS